MYIVPTRGATGSCDGGVPSRARGSKAAGKAPQECVWDSTERLAPFFSLTRHPCSHSLPLSFASAAFVVSFIIPLICCAPARDHHNLSYVFFCLVFHSHIKFMCVSVGVFVYNLCVSFSAVECPIQVPASYSLLPSCFFSLSLAASFRTHSASCARL